VHLVDKMNIWIYNKFNAFLDKHCSSEDLFGQCYSKCRDFLDFIDEHKNDMFDVKRIDANTISVSHNYMKIIIKATDAITFFDNIDDFQKHTKIMAKKLHHNNDNKVSVQCYMMKGIKFNHYRDNVYIVDTFEHKEAVGILHWVILVTSEKEYYVLDPTLKQFHKPPSVLLLNISSQNGLTPIIPNAIKV